VTYWTGSISHNDYDAIIYGLDGFFPQKNRFITSSSLVDMTVRESKSHLVEQITLVDDVDDEVPEKCYRIGYFSLDE